MTLFKRNIIATMSLFGILAITVACKTEKSNATVNSQTEKDTLNITVLQTADIHGQLDTHPELFWEDEEIVFKNRGGLANIQTLFERERQKNPDRTIIVDGGLSLGG